MFQQEVQVVQRGWILVFESVQESFLNHPELNSPPLKQLYLFLAIEFCDLRDYRFSNNWNGGAEIYIYISEY